MICQYEVRYRIVHFVECSLQLCTSNIVNYCNFHEKLSGMDGWYKNDIVSKQCVCVSIEIPLFIYIEFFWYLNRFNFGNLTHFIQVGYREIVRGCVYIYIKFDHDPVQNATGIHMAHRAINNTTRKLSQQQSRKNKTPKSIPTMMIGMRWYYNKRC